MAQWRKHRQGSEARVGLQRAEPRIFPVVEDAAALLHGGEPARQEQALELRLGD